ncbi:biofilm-associated protein [Nitrosopumilus sp. b1]|uniref:biofilm-associated protein n=1 Tax=Nitrosopumilus sp. b1 TaxID=2109907 RepID=UPI0015F5D7EC|nr:biofilm-associated protein [Nitrosopumilus sp. b1]KAF6243894.1 biofilm-associated protein [Nitrosopumilus sp. b1]
MKGIIFSALFAILLLGVSTHAVFAQEDVVSAKSLGFEKTIIIDFTNNGNTSIETFRLWLGSDDGSFKSFKTEPGWTGIKTPQGVLVFTTDKPIKSGESVKFGVKTDKVKPGINWKAIDAKEKELDIGKALVSDLPAVPVETSKSSTPEDNTPEQTTSSTGILSNSEFRFIPDKPKVGSTIRVVGEKFGENQKLDLYLGNTKLNSFESNGDGNFMITTKIPSSQQADRVNFSVKDSQGNEKTVSLRLLETDDVPETTTIPLTVSGLPSTLSRGLQLSLAGTAPPNTSVTATIKNPDGVITTTNATEVNISGKWYYETIIAADAPLGTYTIDITDGKTHIIKDIQIESSELIEILPVKLKYEPGDIMTFNGTAIPNETLEVIIENPQGAEVFSDIFEVDSTGYVEFEFPTSNSDIQGTYIMFGFQGTHAGISLVGLGQLPEVQIIAKMDKLNYKAGETASVALDGPPSATMSIIVVDPSDKTKESATATVTLGPDGKKSHSIDLTGYASGVYTLVVKRGTSQTSEVFTVGLQTGSGEIDIRTTKLDYKPGEAVLILGNSKPNILVTITMYDSEGNVIKVKETYTNKDGVLSDSSFRIPSGTPVGKWKIEGRSGSNFDESFINVVTDTEVEGMIVTFEGFDNSPTVGKLVKIRVIGAQQLVTINIINPLGEEVGKLQFPASGKGEIATPWPMPKDSPKGIYTINVKDAYNSASTTFVLP